MPCFANFYVQLYWKQLCAIEHLRGWLSKNALVPSKNDKINIFDEPLHYFQHNTLLYTLTLININ